MSKQVSFFASKADLLELHQLMVEDGFWLVPRQTSTEAHPPAVKLCDQAFSEFGQIHLLPDDLAVVEAMYVPSSNNPSVDVLSIRTSPVIIYNIPAHDDGVLREGRYYFAMEKDHSLWTFANRRFVRLAKIVKKWRKTDRFRFQVGPDACRLVEQGLAELWHHQLKLGLA